MNEFFAALSALEKVYFISATAGGIVFVIMTVLQFLGGDMDMETDVDVDLDVSSGTADVSFKVISVHGLTAFFMIFGLTGLAMVRDLQTSALESIIGASIAGSAIVMLLKKLFDLFMGLRSSGTLNMNNAVGEEGSVYLSIPATGTGQVQLAIQGRLCTMEAISDDNVEIATGSRVKVVEIVNGSVLKDRSV